MENINTTEARPPTDPWVSYAINEAKSGAWAILMVVILLFWFTRKSLAKFVTEHTKMVSSVKDSNESHAKNAEILTGAVQKLTQNNTVLTKVIAKHSGIDLSDITDD